MPVDVVSEATAAANLALQCVKPATATATPGAEALPAVGYFHPQQAARTLVCGSAAEQWSTATAAPAVALQTLFELGVQQLVLAGDERRHPHFASIAATFPGAVWASSTASESTLVHALRDRAWMADPAHSLHGVMLRVDGLGVLLRGTSGSGKSALALELAARGHALVADDAVDLRRIDPDILMATCPDAFTGFLAVPVLGIVNLARLYGPTAVAARARLDLIITLHARASATAPATGRHRLHGQRGQQRVLGIAVPTLSMYSAAGHNLAVWVEAACADHRVRLAGYRADDVLLKRQRQLLEHATPPSLQAPCN